MHALTTGYERQSLETSWGLSISLGPQTMLTFWVNRSPMKLSTIWWNPYCSVFRYQDGENLSKILPIDILFRHDVFTRGECLGKGIIWNDVFIFVICCMLIHERIWKGSNGVEVHLRSVLYSWLVDDVINHELRTWVKTLPSKCLFAVHKLFLYVYERSMIAWSIRWWMKGQH